jgi:hypothetical protein
MENNPIIRKGETGNCRIIMRDEMKNYPIIVSGETKKRLWARTTILSGLTPYSLVDRYLYTKLHDVTSEKTITLILWHVDPLLGNDREISDYTTAVAR